MDPYAYTPGQTDFRLEPKGRLAGADGFKLSYASAVASPLAPGRATGEYYHPRRAKPRLVIIVHGMGDTSLIPARLLARSLISCGWACYLPLLPVHSSRLPAGTNPYRLSETDWDSIYRGGVVEVRQALDWAAGQPGLDARRPAIIGISFGGFISAIAMSRDRRFGAGVLIESGGNAMKTARLSPVMRLRFPPPPQGYAGVERLYHAYLAEVAARGFENVEPPVRFFRNDPFTFAPGLKDRPLLMVCGLFDEIMPRRAARDLWQASGRQEIMWLPATHATLWAYFPLVSRRVKSFLSRHLAAPAGVAP